MSFEKLEKIIEEAKRVSLEKEEKDEIREFLLSVIKAAGPRLKDQKTQSSWSQLIFVNSFRFLLKPMPLALLLIVVLTGGVSFASENSLPGEFLYPVKVNITEEVRSALTFSTEAKADFEAQRLNKRIEEVEKLAVAGKLNSETRAQIESNFESSSKKVKNEIKRLEANGDFEALAKVNSKFEASLKAHESILEEVLEKIDESGTEVKINLNPLSLRIREEARVAGDSKVRVGEIISERVKASGEAKVEAEASAKARFKAAQNKIDEAKRYIERAKRLVDQEALIEVEAKIWASESAAADGNIKMEKGDLEGALLSFQEAFSLAQEAKVLAKAKSDLSANQNNGQDNEGQKENNHNDYDKSNNSIDIKIDSEIKVNPSGKIELNL